MIDRKDKEMIDIVLTWLIDAICARPLLLRKLRIALREEGIMEFHTTENLVE